MEWFQFQLIKGRASVRSGSKSWIPRLRGCLRQAECPLSIPNILLSALDLTRFVWNQLAPMRKNELVVSLVCLSPLMVSLFRAIFNFPVDIKLIPMSVSLPYGQRTSIIQTLPYPSLAVPWNFLQKTGCSGAVSSERTGSRAG